MCDACDRGKALTSAACPCGYTIRWTGEEITVGGFPEKGVLLSGRCCKCRLLYHVWDKTAAGVAIHEAEKQE
jgi:hypothetical protein